ncbi:uncharacterized protein LOC144447778 [Glandiceps talaboti]
MSNPNVHVTAVLPPSEEFDTATEEMLDEDPEDTTDEIVYTTTQYTTTADIETTTDFTDNFTTEQTSSEEVTSKQTTINYDNYSSTLQTTEKEDGSVSTISQDITTRERSTTGNITIQSTTDMITRVIETQTMKQTTSQELYKTASSTIFPTTDLNTYNTKTTTDMTTPVTKIETIETTKSLSTNTDEIITKVPCTKQCFKGTCYVNDGQQACYCDDGFELHPIRDTLCVDINECTESSTCDQLCQNLPGSYQCQCNPGYVLNSTNQATCIVLNECDSSPCIHGDCEDIVDGYVCSCYAGYTGDRCETEINECDIQPCVFGTCNDQIDAYNCSCYAGYTGVNCEIDFDECGSDPCINGVCSDFINMFKCECYYGWNGVTCDQDINECLSDSLNDCEHNCTNVNTTVDNKGYFCDCNDGFVLDSDGLACSEINECSSNPCNNGGICYDGVNSYLCACSEGWEGDVCDQDIDECERGTSNCDINANCTNTIGAYNCSCIDGYRGDGYICREIIMFPFGQEIGDVDLRDTKEERRSLGMLDLVSPTFSPPRGFPFYDEFYYSLYFTDNGLIVFTKENGDKYPYPYPFPGGFDTNQDTPMIAVFWDDVDLGLADYGRVYYQVYDTTEPLSTEGESIVQGVNKRIQTQYPNQDAPDTKFSDFQANWVLKITWYRVPPFFAEYTNGSPNTFQGTLATDGKYGFVLINYMEDEMLWIYNIRGYTSLNNAIIGYNTGKGVSDEIENAQFTFSSVDDLYRPDQFQGNTGQKGRWIFRVENNEDYTVNAKQECLTWYNQQPDPVDWNEGLGFCPCGFEQGRNDAAFGRASEPISGVSGSSSDSSNQGVDQQLMTTINLLQGQGFCLQTSFANRFGAGQQCCYRDDHSFIDGYDSLWESSYMARYQWINRFGMFNYVAYMQWIELDILPRYFCCTASSDPAFCDMYEEKRPRGSCSGYEPPNIGFMFGDPHITTLDSATYTFNGLGEYILVDVNNDMFELQARTSRFVTSRGQLSNATIFTGFVARQNDSSTVQFTMNEDATDYEMLVDGLNFNKSVLSEDILSFDNITGVQFYIKIEVPSNLTRTVAVFSSGIAVSICVVEGILDAVFSAPVSLKNQTTGLLGVWNDDPTDDFLRRDGTYQQATIPGQNLTEADYFEFGQTWKLMSNESMFTYENGTSWNSYNNNDFVPIFLDEITQNSEQSLVMMAEQVCGENVQCFYDTLATRNPIIGEATKVTSQQFNIDVEDLVNYPPQISADTVINATVGEEVVVEVFATDADGDVIEYSLKTPVTYNATLYANGTFVWTPANLDVVMVGFIASDGRAQSTLIPEVRLCKCQNGGTCNFDEFIDGSDIIDYKFAVVPCICPTAYTGDHCEEDYEGCLDDPCYPGVLCFDNIAPESGARCGPCPDGLVGNGFKCYDYDECSEGKDFNNGSICDQICTNTYESFVCTCNSGYELHPNGRNCLDIDECYINIDDCDTKATCTNTDGGYYCTCNDGYIEGEDQSTCENINECLESPCDDNAVCEDTDGSFMCTCNDGYEGSGLLCADIEECDFYLDDCSLQSTCTNTIGSYICQCNDGWTGNGQNCTNVNECDDPNLIECNPRATCTDVIGSYSCACQQGYAGNGVECQDCDECSTGHHQCADEASCINTQGSYYCECNTGYSGNGFNCTDNNECVDGSACSQHANCTNTEGSYMCECTDGYAGNGLVCNDIDECLTPWRTECDLEYGNCLNTLGGYECQCIAGFQGDGTNCTDINECLSNYGNCGHPLCENLFGGYQCSCLSGYILDADGITCNDINECYLGTDDCPQGCNNTVGGETTCYCYEGFQLDNDNTCQPVESCSQLNCTNGVCYTLNGTEQCLCNRGYKFDRGNDTVCIDIDESTDPDHPHRCEQIVTNTIPGYTCSCNDGFTINIDERTCSDIDECSENSTVCNTDGHQVCVNTYGGYDCVCDSGFQNVTDICQDVDECGDNIAICGNNAYCNNTIGSYYCDCLHGYMGDGYTCEDLNECGLPSSCDDNANCVNTDGSYNCTCQDGFEGDGQNCQDVNECTTAQDNCNDDANCTNTLGSYSCVCNSGFQGDGVLCYDINECTLPDNNPAKASCDALATCNNTYGSYECSCLDGYQSHGNNCTDINECASSSTNDCGVNAVCENIERSYICTCSSGYRSQGRYDCVDIDECVENPMICDDNAACTNSPGTYSCACNSGFQGNGTFCTDLDECLSEVDNNCDPVALCTNYIGSYTCDCPSGYLTVNNSAGRICEDFDECLNERDECDTVAGLCTNTDGSYYCECTNGYEGDGTTCTDIDECKTKPCDSGVDERCVNIPGNYTCQCLIGFHRQDGICQEIRSFEATVVFIGERGLVWTYTEDLDSSGSVKYQTYATVVTEDLDILFQNSSLATDYLGSRVTSMEDGNPNVMVIFLLDFIPESDVTADEIEQAFAAGLSGRYSNIISGDDYVIPETFKVLVAVNNPCLDQTDNCDEHASCVFIGNGNYTCVCDSGWTGNGSLGNCIDINECATNDNLCNDTITECVNTEGSYQCDCIPGYFKMDAGNQTCIYARALYGEFSIYEVNGNPATFTDTLSDSTSVDFNSLEIKVQEVLRYIFLRSLFTRDTYYGTEVLRFSAGSIRTEFVTYHSTDSDYSPDVLTTILQSYADSNDLITVTTGSLSALLSNESVHFEDYDECANSQDNDCSMNATCINTVGSFTCLCTTGFEDTSDDTTDRPGRMCTEICPIDYCLNNGTCIGNSVTNRTCQCPSDYTGDRCNSTVVDGDGDGDGGKTDVVVKKDTGTLNAVAIGLGTTASILLLSLLVVLLVFVVWRRKRTVRHTRQEHSRQPLFYRNEGLQYRRQPSFYPTSGIMANYGDTMFGSGPPIWRTGSRAMPDDYDDRISNISSEFDEDDDRMKQLFKVMKNAPVLKEPLRARVPQFDRDGSTENPISQTYSSDFVVPYVATGEEELNRFIRDVSI